MHPALTIGSGEAIATFGMVQSVIQNMVADMERKNPIPVAGIVEMLPTLDQLALEAGDVDEDTSVLSQRYVLNSMQLR